MTRMLKLCIACFIFVNSANVVSAQIWTWAQVEGQTSGEGLSICSDPSGNCILAGVLQGTNTIGNTTYTSSSLKTCVIKYSPTGALIWHLVFNCGGVCSVASDNSGAIYLSGAFTGSLVVGTNTVFAASGTSCYLLKINASGTPVWLQNFGNPPIMQVSGLATDAAGNSVITGYFSGLTLTFGQTTYVNMGVGAAFVAKYNTNGTPQWADVLSCSGYGYPRPGGVALDASGNVYATGTYSQQIASGTSSISSNGITDVYLVRYNSAGTLQQIQTLGTSGTESGVSIEVAPTGNLFLCGSISGSLCGIGSNTFSTNGFSDAFIANLSNLFILNWVNILGGSGNDVGYSMAPHNTGVFFAASILSNTVSIANFNFSIGNSIDGMALAQFDNVGNYMMVDVLEGGGDDVMDLCLDNACSLFLGGDLLTPTVNFSNISVTHTTFETPFLAKMKVNINAPIVNVAGTFSICAGKSATLIASGAATYSWSTGAQTNSVILSPTTSSYYTLTATSPGYSCPSVFEIPVSVLPNPSISVVASPSAICPGQTSTVIASGANTYSWSSGSTGSVLVIGTVIATGYTVSGSLGICTSTATVPILLHPMPQLTISAIPVHVCVGESFTINVSGASSYTWQNSSTAPSFTVLATSSSQFSVIAQDAQTSCTNTAAYTMSVDACEAISEFSADPFFNFSPNPTSNCLTIVSENTHNMQLLNALGMLVLSFDLEAGLPLKLDLSALPSGLYYLKQTGHSQAKKLLLSPN